MTDERAANRAAFPETARFMDAWRAVFGPGVRLVWAVEDGKSIGKVPEEYALTEQNQSGNS